MRKQTILLIEDDPKVERGIKDCLVQNYNLHAVRSAEAAKAFLAKNPADLILIDYDLKGKDGLQVYKNINPTAKVIMFSASGSIPLAVSAAKLGVLEFLRKPLQAENLKRLVKKNIARPELKLHWTKDHEWLLGQSPALKKTLEKIQEVLKSAQDLVMIAERGIAKQSVAEFIHLNEVQKQGKLVSLDLAGFHGETLEAHFWSTIQELVSLPAKGSLEEPKDRCATLYLENVSGLDEFFKQSIFDFFKERKDKRIRVIIGAYGKAELLKQKDYAWIEIPPLRQRKEDMAYLLALYLKRYSDKYNKNVRFVSGQMLSLLAAYDFPGNYLELEGMIEEAVLAADSDKLELEHFPLDFKTLLGSTLARALEENLTLKQAGREFEKNLYCVLFEKTDSSSGRAARFLDVPKAVLAQRLEDLVD